MDALAANSNPLQPLLTALINNRSVSAYAQGLLFQKPLFIRFRPDVELCFSTKRTLEFSQVFRVASFLW